jgi:hypothetical protein
MRDYGIVSPKFWTGKTGKKLRQNRDAQVIAMYLMTSPHSTMTGVFYCPLTYISHDTGCSIEGTTKGLQCLIEEGFCQYDFELETIFVVTMASWQIGRSLKKDDKRVLGLKRDVENMPSALMRNRFLSVYGEAFHLSDLISERYIEDPPEGPSEPLASQDQDQKQDHDHDQEQEKTKQAVLVVFDHWKSVHSHPRAQLDDKRRALIRKALKTYSEADLCACITGYLASPYHMGKNDANTKYDGIDLFLRDSKHIDAGIKFHVEPPRTDLSAKTLRIIDQTKDWVPPNAGH